MTNEDVFADVLKNNFRVGDVVSGRTHDGRGERGVITQAKNLSGLVKYSVHWEKSGEQAWFNGDDWSIVRPCILRLKYTR